MTGDAHEQLLDDNCPYCAYGLDALSPEVVQTLQHACEIPFDDIVRALRTPETLLAGAMDEFERRGMVPVRAPFVTILDAAALRRLQGSGQPCALVQRHGDEWH